jgi:hypothetical protein
MAATAVSHKALPGQAAREGSETALSRPYSVSLPMRGQALEASE